VELTHRKLAAAYRWLRELFDSVASLKRHGKTLANVHTIVLYFDRQHKHT
jgi:hypothetical protein